MGKISTSIAVARLVVGTRKGDLKNSEVKHFGCEAQLLAVTISTGLVQ